MSGRVPMWNSTYCFDCAHRRVACGTIDGMESVGFLRAVKQMIRDPSKMVFGNKEPWDVVLGF